MDTKERTLYTAILISAVVLGIIISYFILSIIRQQRRNLELNRKNILAEITMLENERGRLSADLHDELGPRLSVLKFLINDLHTDAPSAGAQLEEISNELDAVFYRIRDIARNLMPPTLVRKGLLPALSEFIDSVNAAGTLRIHLQTELTQTLPPETSTNVFRILQEIIQNTLRHAQASHLAIEIRKKAKAICIVCQDDGIGFDYTKASHEASGLGLRNVASRVEILGGTLSVDSRKGSGTQFTIKIPLPT